MHWTDKLFPYSSLSRKTTKKKGMEEGEEGEGQKGIEKERIHDSI